MDKEKQIEEMAHKVCRVSRDCKDCVINTKCSEYDYENFIYNTRKETAREIATKIKAKVDEISSCGLVEEYVTVFNKYIDDIFNGYVEDVENG